MICLGIAASMVIVTRTKSFRYDTVARVSIWGYLSVFISLIFDITVFNADFNEGQVLGILIIFASVIAAALSNIS